MKTIQRLLSFVFAIGILSLSAVSCSKASVADEDALYQNHQGIEKSRIIVPTNG